MRPLRESGITDAVNFNFLLFRVFRVGDSDLQIEGKEFFVMDENNEPPQLTPFLKKLASTGISFGGLV